MNLEELKKEKDVFIHKIFYLGLKIALIFGIPAVGGVLIGKKLDAYFGTGKKISVTILVFAFILSWIITIVMYNKIAKKIKKIEADIALEKKNQKI